MAIRASRSTRIACVDSPVAGIHGELHLTGVTTNPRVRRVLQVTGLLAAFDIHDDIENLLCRLAR